MARRVKRARGTTKARKREPAWTRLSDDELLQKRFCDLRLSLRHSAIERHVRTLEKDLRRRGIRFHPHVWLSTEWFSPDGVPGIAIPCGFSEGLPVSLQVLGPAFGEEAIFRAAYAYEQATTWHMARPDMTDASVSP